MRSAKHRALRGAVAHCRHLSTHPDRHSSYSERCRTYTQLLQQCTNPQQLNQVHAQLITTGIAREPDLLLWNEMIRSHAVNEKPTKTLKLFAEMKSEKALTPNTFTLPFVLKSCAALKDINMGRSVHAITFVLGIDSNVYAANALIDMYSKCKTLNPKGARQVFDEMPTRDLVSWNVMISGYVQNDLPSAALEIFCQMYSSGTTPNFINLKSVLPACAQAGDVQLGKWIHHYIIKKNIETDLTVDTAILDMYAKCGCTGEARQVFDRMPVKNIFSWSAMIAAYAQIGRGHPALKMFRKLQKTGMLIDSVALLSVIPAVSTLAALQHAMSVHAYALRHGIETKLRLGSAIIDMYGKCGGVELGKRFFDRMVNRDVASWNALIMAYGLHGHALEALRVFHKMEESGFELGHMSFLGVISACSHAGLVEEGIQCFESMKTKYNLEPHLEHYACIVDLLGRSGKLQDAEDFIHSMPMKPDAGVWGALLGACKIHRNVKMAKRAARKIFQLEPRNSGYYVLLSNVYAEAGKWNDVAKLRKMMRYNKAMKPPGWSFIEVEHKVHTFFVGDRSHPLSEEIYSMLQRLCGLMKEAGYVTDVGSDLHNVEDEEKVQMLCSHSEKLAISYGLLYAGPDCPIQITKNLRVCDDCHKAMKVISMISKRRIIVRDANRFHHVENGSCSCGDYW